jgi:hypothetical protein
MADRLSAAIARVVADEALLSDIDVVITRIGRDKDWAWSWSQGGCLIFAEAIRRVAGGELFGVFDEVDPDSNDIAGEADIDTLDHVVVALPDDRYADAKGVCDLDTLFGRVESFGFLSPVLLPLGSPDDPIITPLTIAYDEPLVERLVARLRAEMG